MDDPFQQQALGRANAACAALFALYERMEGDQQLIELLEKHAEMARASLLHTSTPEIALSEFDKAIRQFQALISKTR